MKFLHVGMPDYSIWKVDARLIADDRAGYYSEFKREDYDTIYDETMEDNDVLIDWAENNMEWSSVSNVAIKVRDARMDYDDGWHNGYKRIINE